MSEPSKSLTAYNRIVQGRHGPFLANENDMYVGKSLIEYGEFSKGEGDLFQALIKPGMVVIEVGANIGAHTVQLAKLAGEKGVVIAIEPQRIPFQTLCANVQLNSLSNVLAVPVAAAEALGETRVPELDPRAVQNFGGASLGKGSEVRTIPLDLFQRCDFLKLDCEGMELQVLKGAVRLIEKSKPCLYVENDRQEKSEELIQFIESVLGYAWKWHTPPLYSEDNYNHNPVNHFGAIESRNMLCVPKP